jgi:hypothetical protein
MKQKRIEPKSKQDLPEDLIEMLGAVCDHPRCPSPIYHCILQWFEEEEVDEDEDDTP